MFQTFTGPVNPLLVSKIETLLPGDREIHPRFSHQARLAGGGRALLTETEAAKLEREVSAVLAAIKSGFMSDIVAQVS